MNLNREQMLDLFWAGVGALMIIAIAFALLHLLRT